MLCREYGQPLTWYLSLGSGDRAIYHADLLIRADEAKRRARK
jgi:hypothetical protein